MKTFIGSDLDMEAEFDTIDVNNAGKITFERLAKWALAKNMLIELKKQEEIESL